MISLKQSAKKMKAGESPIAMDIEHDEYPYGTRIDLNKDTLEKLKIKTLPAVGDEIMIECKAKVIAVRESASQHDTSRSVELQITDMDLELDEDEVSEGELTRGDSKSMNNLAKKMKSM
jgi:hypothetical protein